jgi:hypothetical protein
MTKKHFEAIAKIIAKHYKAPRKGMERTLLYNLSVDLANYMETENPNFDGSRFLGACMPRWE